MMYATPRTAFSLGCCNKDSIRGENEDVYSERDGCERPLMLGPPSYDLMGAGTLLGWQRVTQSVVE